MKMSRSFADAAVDSVGLVSSQVLFVGFSNGDSITMTVNSLKVAAVASAVRYIAEDDVEEDDFFVETA